MVDISLARRTPMAAGSSTVRPQPGMMPTRAWVSAKRARSEATRKSQARATSKPPVIATPLIAPMTGVAMVGNGPLSLASPGVALPPSPSARLLLPPTAALPTAPASDSASGPPAASSLRSMPAQKAGSAPVRTMARTSSRSSSSWRVVGSAFRSARLSALRASGRLSVTVATGPSISTSTMSSGTATPPRRPVGSRASGRPGAPGWTRSTRPWRRSGRRGSSRRRASPRRARSSPRS